MQFEVKFYDGSSLVEEGVKIYVEGGVLHY